MTPEIKIARAASAVAVFMQEVLELSYAEAIAVASVVQHAMKRIDANPDIDQDALAIELEALAKKELSNDAR